MTAMYLTDVAWIFLRYKSVTFHSVGCGQIRSAALTEFEVAGEIAGGKQGGDRLRRRFCLGLRPCRLRFTPATDELPSF
jgi:hypothetical protein